MAVSRASAEERMVTDGDRVRLLGEAARRLAEGSDSAGIRRLAALEACRLLGAERAVLRLFEAGEPGGTTVPRPGGARGDTDPGEALTAIVAATSEALAVEDLTADARCSEVQRRAAAEQGIGAFLGVPLRARGRTTGALGTLVRGRRRFDPVDVSLLTTWAGHVAAALENARADAEGRAPVVEDAQRIASLERRLERVRTLGRLTQLVSSSLDTGA